MDLAKLLATLNHLHLEGEDPVTAREVAELLWLAQQINPSATLPERASPLPEQSAEVGAASVSPPSLPNPATPSNPAPPSNQVGVHLRGKEELESGGSEPKKVAGSGSLAFRSPTGAALPGSLELARALRPLMRRVPSRSRFLLNEKATVQRIAEEDIWSPVLDPAPEHWLDVALVLDEGPSMALWQRTFSELRRLLECQGAFKNVRTWGLDSSSRDKLSFYAGAITGGNLSRRSTSPNELVSLRGRRLIMLVTDCISPAWYGETLLKILQSWGEHNTLVVVQVLPQRLWRRTALGIASAGRLDLPFPGAVNQRAALTESSNIFADKEELVGLPIPVVTLEPPILNAWAKIIGQAKAGWTPLFVLNPPWREQRLEPYSPVEIEPEKLLQQFRAVASPLAQRLAVFLAATPISLPVVRLVQRTMLPQSRQVHLAELFLSGLLKLTAPHPHPDYAQYDFVEPKVRALLLDSLLFSESLTVLEEVSKLVASRTGLPLDFQALLADPEAVDGLFIPEDSIPFATVAATVLHRLGGDYSQLASRIETRIKDAQNPPPPQKQEAEKRRAKLEEEQARLRQQQEELQLSNLLDQLKKAEKKEEQVTERIEPSLRPRVVEKLVSLLQAPQGFPPTERAIYGRALSLLGDPRPGVGTWKHRIGRREIELPQIEWCEIPAPKGGKFVMGSSDWSDNPRREVALGYSFKMAKYTVTYQQFQTFIDSGEYDTLTWWKDFPKDYQRQKMREQEFKYDNHPRERVTWFQAVAFTRWLDAKYREAGLLEKGDEIRLPIEEEWEYAARGKDERKYPYLGEFDKTKGNTYESGIGMTSAVGSFPDGASPFGVLDLSGNVWEWCLNEYYNPKALINFNSTNSRVLRGGAFDDDAYGAASAFRNYYDPRSDYSRFGFRVVVFPPIRASDL